MREIYIFFEHPTPATHSTLRPACTSPPAAACQHQRFVSRRMCGRARLTNCRNPCTGYSHLPLAPCSWPCPCPCCCPCCCPHSLAKPLAAQPTRYLSFNATHHQQQRRQQRRQPQHASSRLQPRRIVSRQHHILFTASGSCT